MHDETPPADVVAEATEPSRRRSVLHSFGRLAWMVATFVLAVALARFLRVLGFVDSHASIATSADFSLLGVSTLSRSSVQLILIYGALMWLGYSARWTSTTYERTTHPIGPWLVSVGAATSPFLLADYTHDPMVLVVGLVSVTLYSTFTHIIIGQWHTAVPSKRAREATAWAPALAMFCLVPLFNVRATPAYDATLSERHAWCVEHMGPTYEAVVEDLRSSTNLERLTGSDGVRVGPISRDLGTFRRRSTRHHDPSSPDGWTWTSRFDGSLVFDNGTHGARCRIYYSVREEDRAVEASSWSRCSSRGISMLEMLGREFPSTLEVEGRAPLGRAMELWPEHFGDAWSVLARAEGVSEDEARAAWKLSDHEGTILRWDTPPGDHETTDDEKPEDVVYAEVFLEREDLPNEVCALTWVSRAGGVAPEHASFHELTCRDK